MLVKPHYAAIAGGHVGGLGQTGGLPVGPAPVPHIDYWESVYEVFIRNCPPLAEEQITNICALKVGAENKLRDIRLKLGILEARTQLLL